MQAIVLGLSLGLNFEITCVQYMKFHLKSCHSVSVMASLRSVVYIRRFTLLECK